jgi:DNA uptake protein ComE-like DNA-binding protein
MLAVVGTVYVAALMQRGRARELTLAHEELPPARVFVNRAGVAELSALPGIGAKKAEKIIDARKKAPIESLEQMARAASGISAANLERMKPFVDFSR